MLAWPSPQIPELPGRGGPVLLYDTAGGGVLPVGGPDGASMYVCGITPYDATHLGHAATYVAFDLLNRAWRDAGFPVRYASNVTDVDDPLLQRAAETGVDWRDLAVGQTALFAEDMTSLGVIPPDDYLGAVETIPRVVQAVERLLADGRAYRVAAPASAGMPRGHLGDVYADLGTDPAFGSLSGLSTAAMLTLFAERGGDPDRAGKRNRLDPLLWRGERPGEPAWDGRSLGAGRPGWHIECAVIAMDTLGIPFTVQGGGSDLVFPHHEMSASHARALTGADRCATGHAHAGMVGLAGQKMSKSVGNLVLVSRLTADGVEPMVIRLALLAHHYRADWEWTGAELPAAQRRWELWRAAVSGTGGPDATGLLAALRAALADDLDAPAALAAMDAWAALSLAHGGDDEGAPGLAARAVNALLGVRL